MPKMSEAGGSNYVKIIAMSRFTAIGRDREK
jgi:hypothetical protein